MLATHLQTAIEITKLCFLLFIFHFGHIANQKASKMCRWVILVSARSSPVQGECFMPLSPSVSLSPLCCLGYISWWDVRPTWIGTFFAHMQTHTQELVNMHRHTHCYTNNYTDTHLLTAKLGLQCAVTGHYLCNYWFWSDLKRRKCKKQTVLLKIKRCFSFSLTGTHNHNRNDLLSWQAWSRIPSEIGDI